MNSPSISKQPDPVNTVTIQCHELSKTALTRNYDIFPRFVDEDDLIFNAYLHALEIIITLRMLYNKRNGINASKSDLMKQLQDDIDDRNTMGTENYGVPLSPFNGRDFLTDAYQEGLDLAAYVSGLVYELYHKE